MSNPLTPSGDCTPEEYKAWKQFSLERLDRLALSCTTSVPDEVRVAASIVLTELSRRDKVSGEQSKKLIRTIVKIYKAGYNHCRRDTRKRKIIELEGGPFDGSLQEVDSNACIVGFPEGDEVHEYTVANDKGVYEGLQDWSEE